MISKRKKHLEQVNRVLVAMVAKYYPNDPTADGMHLFYNEKGNLTLANRRYSLSARLRIGGNYTVNTFQNFGFGGTLERAFAQLIRWQQGKSHWGISAFEIWHKRGLGDDKFLEVLRESDFENPELCKCVLCGLYPIQSLDWWYDKDKSGPCCSLGTCQEKKES